MDIRVGWQDITDLVRFDNALKALDDKTMRKVATRALNRTGDMGRTRVVKGLALRTGLPNKVVLRYLRVKRAEWGALEYRITARGNDISLRHFRPRETRKGVVASPFGKRTLFPGRFMKAGLFPNRVVVGKFNGHVFEPVGGSNAWGRPFERTQSGVVLSDEMVKEASASVWRKTVSEVLPRRLGHEIEAVTSGVISK